MSKYSVEITEPAENDLSDIVNYIAKELLEPDIAIKTVSHIGRAITELEGMPLRNNLVSDEHLSFLGIRKLLVENYIVFYIVNEDLKTVTIIRILHGKRDWINLL